jgi:hypothetical protein
MDFDAVLSGVLRSTAEMDEVKGLNGGERQLVIDVLAQVSPLSHSVSMVNHPLTPRPPVRGNKRCHERAREEMLKVTLRCLRRRRSVTDTIHVEPK